MTETVAWVPKEQRDTRWYIWFKKFWCRLPLHHTYSIDELRSMGVPTTFDSRLDRHLMNEPADRMYSINEMFEFWRQGVPISLKNYSDAEVVYKYISDHLNAMKLEMERAYRIDGFPIEDLMKLDEFASVVYSKAKYSFTKAEVDSILARRMSSLLNFNKATLLLPKASASPPPADKPAEEVDPYPKRNELKGYFANFAKLTSVPKQ